MRRLLLSLMLAWILVPSLGIRPVWACSCVASSPRDLSQRADAVFTGIAGKGSGGYLEVRTVFRVETVYKGPVDAVIEVHHPVQGGACGERFAAGRRFTVFAYHPNSNEAKANGISTLDLETNICSGNHRGSIEGAKYRLEATLVPSAVGRPSAGTTVPAWTWVLVAAGLVAVVGAALVVRRRRQLR